MIHIPIYAPGLWAPPPQGPPMAAATTIACLGRPWSAMACMDMAVALARPYHHRQHHRHHHVVIVVVVVVLAVVVVVAAVVVVVVVIKVAVAAVTAVVVTVVVVAVAIIVIVIVPSVFHRCETLVHDCRGMSAPDR